MFHTAAFYQSVDPAAAYVQLAAIGDSILTVNSPKIQVPTLNQIILAAAGLENTVAPRARLVTPSILSVFRHQVAPVNVAAGSSVLPQSPPKIIDLRQDPLLLVTGEQLTAEILSDPAAATIQWLLVWFADGKPAPVSGKVFTARATVSNALTANTWSLDTLSFDDQLPRGRYQVVGFRPQSTNIVGARLIIPGQSWRPGALGASAVGDTGSDIFRYGNLGVWGEFEDVDNLQVETLATSADAAGVQIHYVDLIQVRSGPG